MRPSIAHRAASLFLAAVLVFAGTATAQEGPAGDELDERQFEAARRLERSGQLEEAVQAYRTLLTRSPQGPWADEALLSLARIACPAERPELGPDGLMPCDEPGIQTALGHLQELERLCPGRQACAEGAWRRAVLRWLPTTTRHDPAAARALLTTFPVLYPDSSRVPAALALAARLHRQAGAAAEAGRLAYRLLAEWPAHPSAPRAWLELARLEIDAGRPGDALFALGRVQRLAPDTAEGRTATGWATQLDRLTWAETRGETRWGPPENGPAYEDVTDLVFDARDRLVLALPRQGTVLVLDADGSEVERRPVPEVRAVAIDRWGRSWAAGEAVLAAPAGVSLPVPERAEPVAVVPSGAAGAFLVDERYDTLYRVDMDRAEPRRIELADRAEPIGAVPDPDSGGLWLLDGRRARLERRNAEGEPELSVDLEAVVAEPIDVALGPLGHVFVLDAEGPEIWIVDGRNGQLLGYHRVPAREGLEWDDPTEIAVDSTGRVALYDEREGRIRWLR
jgi:tetratricopeptide (TPR) repeat protein